ncbi:hypothetical protein DTO013E5_9460 [Penicillium roqueforti]|uniref:Uncharacterized protein n=1 Tax=Penicillium roqueforti (strain FM164) TaxID=1365484 RepID=W6QME8_PENRF|nr:uncharacterized protein LCP9604111_9604 [Penicillium roqueforti]CDM37146.1 unnamed protein product [Penicillium roqueforti FM164]KAF9238030.1 hypothetical protein LCP9604111_9604 [Penicillium roqueforti]KAI1833451.1 hypothetical protein CBS147337_5949 [Penicillium roqueforti]KAI2671681.1 hypothetical protein LCP963914a_9610 [Penicillium roqueforti]KAI2671757.1 hypothetical protein CBS147355_8400 [Penicillium roqueforti]
MSDPRLVDMEPGGESTQYESIREFTKSPPKQTGQLGVGQKHTISEASPDLGTHSPGPASSNDEDAQAQKLGMGALADPGKDMKRDEDDAVSKARRQQGYGPGSGVGA